MTNLRFFLIYLFVSGVLLFPSCRDCDPITKPVTERVPYTDIEEKNVKLEYEIEDESIYYRRIEGAILFGENPQYVVYATIRNTSKHGGKFKLYATLESQGDAISFEEEKYISGNSTVKIESRQEINPFTFKANVKVKKWGIISPVVTVKEEVTKYRTVTNYTVCHPCDEYCGEGTGEIPTWQIILGVLLVIGAIYAFIDAKTR